jgi:hypothetical protein
LRQRGRDALPHLVDGREHLDHAVGQHAHRHALGQVVAAGPLEEGGDAQAAQPALLLALGAARLEAVPVGLRQRLVHHVLEAADVVGLAHRVLVGHLLGPDEVAPAQLHAVDARLARGLVHQPLHGVDRFGPAGAAVGAGGRGVGQHRLEAEVDQRDVVHAGLHPGPDQQLDGDAGAGGVGAHVGLRVHAQRQDAAVGGQRQFGVRAHVAAVVRGQEFLAAVGGPLHRALQLPGAPGDRQVLGIGAGLHAEAAADVAHRHAHLLAREAQHVAQRGAHARRHLRAHAQREAAVVGDRRQHGARLQRQRRHALVGCPASPRGPRPRRPAAPGGIAIARLGGDVVGRAVAQRHDAALRWP